MGKTQGVRLSSNPPTNSTSSQASPPRCNASSSRSSAPIGAAGAPPGGGAVVKPEPSGAAVVSLAGAGAAAVSAGAPAPAPASPAIASASVNGTLAGARHTWSLQAWNFTWPASGRAPAAAPAATVIGTETWVSPSYTASAVSSKESFTRLAGGYAGWPIVRPGPPAMATSVGIM